MKAILLVVLIFSLGWVSHSVLSGIYYKPNNNDLNNEFDNYLNSNSFNINSNNNDFYLDSNNELSFEGVDVVNEKNESTDSENEKLSLVEEFERLLRETPEERDQESPHDWISMDQIKVYNNRVVLEIDDPEWSIFTNTKSMDPVIDGTSNAIEVVPQSEKDIHVGDIVAYRSKYADGVITHRVVELGSDRSGWYARLKGDNNKNVDPGKVRFDQIERVVVAVIY